jgi:hypothetical protein
MSLLIDALRQAERAKAAQSGSDPLGETSKSTLPAEPLLEVTQPLTLTPDHAADSPSAEKVGHKSEPALTRGDPFPERLTQRKAETAQPLHVGARPEQRTGDKPPRKGVEATKESPQAAKGLFAAKQPVASNKNRIGLFLVAGLAVLLLAGGGFYIWYQLAFPPPLPMPANYTPRSQAMPAMAAAKNSETKSSSDASGEENPPSATDPSAGARPNVSVVTADQRSARTSPAAKPGAARVGTAEHRGVAPQAKAAGAQPLGEAAQARVQQAESLSEASTRKPSSNEIDRPAVPVVEPQEDGEPVVAAETDTDTEAPAPKAKSKRKAPSVNKAAPRASQSRTRLQSSIPS